MRTRIPAVLVAMMAMLFIIPSMASATPPNPQDPCEHNPTTLCGPDISITTPTEAECPAGGIVVVLNDVRYPICNGAAGSNGSDGSNGTDGTDGTDGSDGANGSNGEPGQNGTNGSDGANGAAGSNGSNGSDGVDGVSVDNTCTSTRTARMPISVRKGAKVTNLKATFHGKKLKVVRKGTRRWSVKVPLAGLPQGVWAVHVRARVNGKLVRRAHLFRTCYGTVTHGEGLNNKRQVRL